MVKSLMKKITRLTTGLSLLFIFISQMLMLMDRRLHPN